VARYCAIDPDRQGQFDALVSFAFNVGLGNLQRSTLRMKHNRGDHWGAASEFMKWTKAAGKVLPGLVSRRQDEARMYLSP
jgi:lysozyme